MFARSLRKVSRYLIAMKNSRPRAMAPLSSSSLSLWAFTHIFYHSFKVLKQFTKVSSRIILNFFLTFFLITSVVWNLSWEKQGIAWSQIWTMWRENVMWCLPKATSWDVKKDTWIFMRNATITQKKSSLCTERANLLRVSVYTCIHQCMDQ